MIKIQGLYRYRMAELEARRILVVDDTPAIHVDFHKILRGGQSDPQSLNATRDMLFGEVSSQKYISWDVDSAHQGDEGVEKVRKSLEEGRSYSVAFIDMRMPPGPNGLETTKKIWQLDPEILVVLCTAYTDFTWNEIVAQLGTSDRLLILKKPFESIEVRQMALALSERWSVARTDPLTRVLNRRAWIEHSRRWWLRSNPGESLSCIMLDLDHFKRINDSYGHQAGDCVLVATADLLRRTVRPQDVVARYGGEEFCILMPAASEAVATEWAAHLLSELRNMSVAFGSLSLAVTASIGVAERTQSVSTATQLIEAADKALYAAKRSGRDRVVACSMLNGIDLPRLDAPCSERDPYPAECHVVELLLELQTECGEFLRAVRADQTQFAAPVIQQVCKFQEQLTDAIAKRHLAAQDQSRRLQESLFHAEQLSPVATGNRHEVGR